MRARVEHSGSSVASHSRLLCRTQDGVPCDKGVAAAADTVAALEAELAAARNRALAEEDACLGLRRRVQELEAALAEGCATQADAQDTDKEFFRSHGMPGMP